MPAGLNDVYNLDLELETRNQYKLKHAALLGEAAQFECKPTSNKVEDLPEEKAAIGFLITWYHDFTICGIFLPQRKNLLISK